MITQYRPAYYDNPRASTLSGLSTDQKPTDVENGARYEEIDTGKAFCFDKENKAWYEMPQSGGGGSSVSEVAMQEVPLDPVPSGDYYSINLSEFFNTYFGITQTVVNGIDIGKYYGKGLEYLKIDVIATMTDEGGNTMSSKAVLSWGFDSVASLATGMGYNQAVFSNHYGSITAICYNVGGDGGADPLLIKFNLKANSLAETMASQAKAAILAANGMTEEEAQAAGITISTSNPVINLFDVQAGGI